MNGEEWDEGKEMDGMEHGGGVRGRMDVSGIGRMIIRTCVNHTIIHRLCHIPV